MKERTTTAPVKDAIAILEDKVCNIVTVQNWARAVGYDCPKSFSDAFRKEFNYRPQPVLIAYRTRKAVELLRDTALSNYEIARTLKLRNEKGLYQFVKEQTGYAPTEIENLAPVKYEKLQETLSKNIIE